MELCERSWGGIVSLELHLAIGVAQLLVRPLDSSRLVVELDGHRGVWQLPSRCTLLVSLAAPRMIKPINTRTAQYWRDQQHHATCQ